ncbi:NAD(P)-dependent dehydrogenase, short-chain alcohol dehydrogenase family [Chryseobacterium soldanellicola]|uniref:NAD(P)-dependent dehydrogenase, short-chain alcohol dehydrogenase family n=1 Tax=Chryseobacterium soldanellicola TaxID=311333 RepID=A0A1H1F8B2_9FLAO|nr:SDR family oxidoreductase [Chryseobacterium soldanellicola]SDQ96999.1 NAD(P)-dependent dehydrogenase, short-chain alcohol dehydrogenase family [Chryseobacterium soldanellicola]
MKTAFITGANKGIGFETAKQLLENGYFVFIGSRNIDNGESAVQQLKKAGFENIHAIRLDVSDITSIEEARKEIGKQTDILDVLINNAGINGGMPQAALEAPVESFQKVMDTNLYGVIRMTQAFMDLLKKSEQPRIVNVSSSGCSLTLHSDPEWIYYSHKAAVYTASKAAMNMYTINLAYELRDTAFKVNAVCPGFVATDFNNHRGTGTVEEGGQRIAKYAMITQDGPTGKFISEEYNSETGETPW